MRNRVYLSLGSNIGDREGHIREAIARLGEHGRVVAVSAIYETEPVEFTAQAWFLNCVAAFETGDTAPQLMGRILEIEKAMGRKRGENKGPRNIDIDIILFGDAVVNT